MSFFSARYFATACRDRTSMTQNSIFALCKEANFAI